MKRVQLLVDKHPSGTPPSPSSLSSPKKLGLVQQESPADLQGEILLSEGLLVSRHRLRSPGGGSLSCTCNHRIRPNDMFIIIIRADTFYLFCGFLSIYI